MVHLNELHTAPAEPTLNWLRAAVLGANDGIVSIAGLVFGVLGATSDSRVLLATGIAGMVAGALSMAAGEYVSVSSSRDAQQALLAKERFELQHYPEQEFEELKKIYRDKGLSEETANSVAKELTAHDVFTAHAEAELKIDPHVLANPLQAAAASATSFFVGALIPLSVILIAPSSIKAPMTFTAVVLALSSTGFLSASVGGAKRTTAVLRVVVGGILAMAITFGIGTVVGVTL